MPTASPWVETTTSIATGRVYPSHKSNRLVFFKNGTIQVCAPGMHRVWPFSGITAIAMVRMTMGLFEINIEEDAPTKDQLRVNMKLSVTMSVKEEDGAIARVAANASIEEKIVGNAVVAAVRSAIGRLSARELDQSLDGIRANILSAASQEAESTDSAFKITGVAIDNLNLASNTLRGHAERIATEAWKAEELSVKKATIQIESENKQIPKLNDARTDHQIEREAGLMRLDLKDRERLMELHHYWIKAQMDLKMALQAGLNDIALAKKRAEMLEKTVHGFAALHPELYAQLESERIRAGTDKEMLARFEDLLRRVIGAIGRSNNTSFNFASF